jgi:hypothetical protein
MANFASSDLAIPYIKDIPEVNHIDIKKFTKYALQLRDSIQNIETLKKALVIEEKNTHEEAIQKLVFKNLSEIFMKYFCVNWIFSGKIRHKIDYLKFRGTILRRIKEPQTFTYLLRYKKSAEL